MHFSVDKSINDRIGRLFCPKVQQVTRDTEICVVRPSVCLFKRPSVRTSTWSFIFPYQPWKWEPPLFCPVIFKARGLVLNFATMHTLRTLCTRCTCFYSTRPIYPYPVTPILIFLEALELSNLFFICINVFKLRALVSNIGT